MEDEVTTLNPAVELGFLENKEVKVLITLGTIVNNTLRCFN